MIIKDSIFTMGNIIEALAKHTAKKISGTPERPIWLDDLITATKRIIKDKKERNKVVSRLKNMYNGNIGFKKALNILVENKIINELLRDKLLKIWNIRNKVHLLNLREKEHNKYDDDLYMESKDAFMAFVLALKEAYKEGKL